MMSNTPAKAGSDSSLIVGIGASAGGIQAIKSFFEHVPQNSGIAYVVILHLSPDHDSKLVEIIQLITPLPVVRVSKKTKVLPNTIYVISPNKHLWMSDGEIAVTENVQLQDRRAPVDIFLRTLGESHGRYAVAVILSGTGANGSMGLKRLKEKGGAVYVQSPREAEFNEMPRNAIATDLVDEVLPVSAIPGAVMQYRQKLDLTHLPVAVDAMPDTQSNALKGILTKLKNNTGHDFTNYKRPTILRRIERRITVKNMSGIEEYNDLLVEKPEEVVFLLKDLLISVTNFFRDIHSFNFIEATVWPKIIKDKNAGGELRVWIAGCATGEEAYSIAMQLAEQTFNILEAPKVQIFATDIDEDALLKAREGYYTINDAADVSPERLRRFFSKEGEGFRVRKELREMILFANHNFIKDPPFSHLDFISCRNVLIYLNDVAQRRAMESFHFALNNSGFLFLGSSESVELSDQLYEIFNRDAHIYTTRTMKTRIYPVPDSVPVLKIARRAGTANKEQENGLFERLTMADLPRRMLEEYAPPSLIVDQEYKLIHLTDGAAKYLQFTGGEPSQDLLKSINPDLRLEIRSALFKAVQNKKTIRINGLRVSVADVSETINVIVKPVFANQQVAKGYILLVFEKMDGNDIEPASLLRVDEPISQHLEQELSEYKSQLRVANEQHVINAEELKAGNEELQAMNEEMRSATEELETSREELQSMNEELRTVNQELKVKVEEAIINSNNLRNLINSSSIGTIFLDKRLRIALFTPSALSIFNLIPSDNGRPLSDITHRLEPNDLLKDAETVLEKLTVTERELKTIDDRIYLARLLPYRTSEDVINGVVITFFDITTRKKSEEALLASEERFRNFVTATYDRIFRVNADWTSIHNIKGMEYVMGSGGNSAKWIDNYLPGSEQKIMENAIDKAKLKNVKLELTHRAMNADGSPGWALTRAVPVFNLQHEVSEWFGVSSDITLQKNSEEALHRSEERFRLMAESGLLAIAFVDTAGRISGGNEIFFKYTGLETEHLKRSEITVMSISPPIWKKRIEQAMQEFNDAAIFSPYEQEYLHIDGTVGWAMIGGARFGNRKEGVFFMLDISDLKALEQQKDGLIGIASHELKTPVSSIQIYCDVLQERLATDVNHENRDLVKKMSLQVKRLSNLISSLLDVTKITAGGPQLVFSAFNIHDLILSLIKDLQRLSPQHVIRAELESRSTITADRLAITQVLTNLIHNGIKYSPQGGDILIRSEDFEKGIKISVQDHGIGISPKFVDHVFDRFFRVNIPEIETYPGMGLGLFISAAIVKKHGGNIAVSSKEHEGSLFYFTLPDKSV